MTRTSVQTFFSSINWGEGFATIGSYVPDAIQIAILYFVIYSVLKAARGSRFGQVLMGAGILVTALAAFTFLFQFDVLQKILSGLLIYLALSTVVLFQPEIRRILETVGAVLTEDKKRRGPTAGEIRLPEKLADILFLLAKRRLGALVAIERAISLKGYETTGIALDAQISTELMVSIFTPPLPLHDGGVIIRGGRLAAAHCLFPVSDNQFGLSASGMRHRAAVGISEETDALALVVSEERGLISVAHNGRLTRYPDLSADTRKALVRFIGKVIPQQRTVYEMLSDWLDKRGGQRPRILQNLRRPFGAKREGSTK